RRICQRMRRKLGSILKSTELDDVVERYRSLQEARAYSTMQSSSGESEIEEVSQPTAAKSIEVFVAVEEVPVKRTFVHFDVQKPQARRRSRSV
ncbi:unnamed protein product, partial [Symbiodinium sp. CCMP2592]